MRPTQEWTTIAGEFATAASIYTRYVLAMAAIGPVASTVGTIAFGERSSLATLGDSYAMSVGDALTTGVLEYALNLVGVWALGMLISLLAPSLGAQRNPVQALKVAAYGSTPYWLAGALALLPKLAPIGALLGFYSIRLFAQGLALVLKVPRDRAAAYTLLATIGAIIVVLVIGALSRVFV
ncbi:MAG TPA: Yip1 family protein [Gemmatimonadales bacterium]|nr:Yip1 family protein [Gemmatimonadales bacterium]